MYLRIILNIIISFGGWMLAVWGRVFIPLGKEFGDNTPTIWPPVATLIIITSIFLAYSLSYLVSNIERFKTVILPQRQFRILVIGNIISIAIFTFFLPDISQLQLVYYFIGTFIIGLMTIVMPDRIRRASHQKVDILSNLNELYQKRRLLTLWLRYRVEDRYAQTTLGIMWIVLLPVMQSLVMAFAFGTLLGAREVNGAPWILFLLSGIATFGIFRDMLVKAKSSVTGEKSIISRVYFPREILVILTAGENLIDFIFVFATLTVFALLYGVPPNIYYLLLPIPIFCIVVFSTGFSFIVAWLSVIIRDLQQLIGVLLQLFFYIVVLYSPNRAPEYAALVNIIPFVPVVNAVRDIVVFGKSPDLVSLYYPLVTGFMLLYFGYVYFKANEDRIVDFV